MSLTITVPAAVPSLFHSSSPFTPSLAQEEQRAVDVGQFARIAVGRPGTDVLDQRVPAAVPSLFHSSKPLVPSLALKNSVPLTFRKLSRLDGEISGFAIAAHRIEHPVPASVPLVSHSFKPLMPSLATKNSVLFTFVRNLGTQGRAAARRDVLDQDGPGARAVGLPQLGAVQAVVGREE